MQSLDKSGVDLEAGERGDGGRRNSAAVSGGRPCSSEVSGVPAEKRISSVSECSVEVDLEGAYAKEETKLHFLRTDRDCRICHLSMDSENQEPSGTGGVFIELGCSCKDDLAAAHKHCAEAWFKIKGNRICEICGSIASNVASAPGRVSSLLARPSVSQLHASLYGFRLCNLLALSLQRLLVNRDPRRL
nr:Zinc finger, RING-CH-type [Ipomoea batatas]